MLGTGVYAEHLETYGHNGGKNSLTQLFNGQETEMYVYLSEKTRMGDELGEPNEYMKGADGSKGDLIILAGRQVCPYNIDDEYPISLNDYESGNLEVYGKSEITTTLVTLNMLQRGENEKISEGPEAIHCDLLQDDETQSDDASEQWESAETTQSVEVLMDVPTLEEWRHQGFDGTICLQGKMEDTIPGWFSRMNRKVLDKLTIRAAKLKSFYKTWMGARPKKYDYWAVLESMLRTDNMAYDYMMGTMGSASADANSGEEPAVFMPEFQGIAERIRALSSALNIKEDQYYFVEDVQLCTEEQDANITNDNEQVCTETPLTPVVSPTDNVENANWKRPKPHIVFAGKETRVYHPFQSPSDYLAEVSHADSLAPGPLDIDTTCRQFKTKYKDLVIIYLRWDFVQKSGQSPGTGPFGWFFLMFSNGGTVPVYITERVHRVVFEKPDNDEAEAAKDDVEMEWPEGLKMPVNNNKRWEGRSVYIPMDEFSKDLVCRSKEAAVERYYATLKVLEG